MPTSTFLSPETRAIKTQTCRTCMHDALRAHGTAPASAYCALDLFAPEPERVERAVRALWDGWAVGGGGDVLKKTKSRLRIFAYGRMLRPDDVSRQSLLHGARVC
jgi:inositol-pentakisphosphate 2-kinase